MMICAVARLTADERKQWSPLNVDLLLRQYASRGKRTSETSPGQTSEANCRELPTGRPDEPWEDLTERVRHLTDTIPSPFDGDPAYGAFFMRSLLRSSHSHRATWCSYASVASGSRRRF